MDNAVNCKRFQMWNWSPTMLFGVSPKVEYICGKCGGYNKGRFGAGAMGRKGAYVRCFHCGCTNIIPVKVEGT